MNWQNVATIACKDLTVMLSRRTLRIGLHFRVRDAVEMHKQRHQGRRQMQLRVRDEPGEHRQQNHPAHDEQPGIVDGFFLI